MERILDRYRELLTAVVCTIVVVWQLFAPGYLFLLDWVSGPEAYFSYGSLSDYMGAPLGLLLYVLGSLFPAWVLQKIIFVGLIFLLFYVPLKISLFESIFVRLFGSLFFVLNPFVYERLLAGQWRVVTGYLFLYVIAIFALRLGGGSLRDFLRVFAVVCLCGFISLHFFVIGVLFLLFVFVWRMGVYAVFAAWQDLLREGILWCKAGVALLVFSLYWILPYFFLGDQVVSSFSSADWDAFQTVGSSSLGAYLNVLVLHGFWLEGQAWADQFSLVSAGGLLWVFSMAVLFALMAAGWRQVRDRFFLTCIGFVSSVFAVGVGVSVFAPVNQFLFENVSFWGGFRDSQKWVGLLVIVYLLFAQGGVARLASLLGRFQQRVAFSVITSVCLLPVLLVPQMLFGFGGQISVRDYPAPWREVRRSLIDWNTSTGEYCKMVFLPWQHYYTLGFNDGQITANVADKFFPCDVYASKDAALGAVGPIASHIDGYDRLDKLVTSNDPSDSHAEMVIMFLRELGVTHIVMTDDLVNYEAYMYPFLDSDALRQIYDQGGIRLYKVRE